MGKNPKPLPFKVLLPPQLLLTAGVWERYARHQSAGPRWAEEASWHTSCRARAFGSWRMEPGRTFPVHPRGSLLPW